MGSVLAQTGGTQTIWSDDLTENYHTLIRNPGLLKWVDNPANARLMRFVNVKAGVPFTNWHVPFKKLDLWGRVIDLLHARPDIESTTEFGYDWRAPLENSSRRLAEALRTSIGADLTLAQSENDARLVLIAHSMGGLVVRIAIANGLIHPSWIDRIIHIGTPLRVPPTRSERRMNG